MRVSVGQLGCDRDLAANRERVRALVTASDADLIVLPEYAQVFDPREPAADLAEKLDGPFVSMLRELAAGGRIIVAGMLERRDGGKPFNTVVAVGPRGLIGVYRKIHLYDAYGAKESAVIAPGDPSAEPLVFDACGQRVGVLTCFDLRFGVSAQRLADAGADVILVPAAWAAGPNKVDHWTTLLRARAIEHRCWVAGAGMAGPGVIGHSMLIDPVGKVIASAGADIDNAAPAVVGHVSNHADTEAGRHGSRRCDIAPARAARAVDERHRVSWAPTVGRVQIRLIPVDPVADRARLIEFLTRHRFPFHSGPPLSEPAAAQRIDAGRFDSPRHLASWIEGCGTGVVGLVVLHDTEDESPTIDLRIGEGHRGQGWGVRALRAATSLAFERDDALCRIEGTTRADNVAMIRTFLGAGFVKEAHYREAWPMPDGARFDAVGYAILRRDWASGACTPVPW